MTERLTDDNVAYMATDHAGWFTPSQHSLAQEVQMWRALAHNVIDRIVDTSWYCAEVNTRVNTTEDLLTYILDAINDGRRLDITAGEYGHPIIKVVGP